MTQFPVSSWGGLNLYNSPDEVGFAGAVDCSNVDLSTPGVLKSRQGYTTFSSALSGSGGRACPFYYDNGGTFTRQLVVGDGADIRVLSSAGASVATETAPTRAPSGFAAYGEPGSETLYIATGDAITSWDGTGFATLAADVRPLYVAVQPRDNRLVAARQFVTSGSFTESRSRVYFSAAGDPTTFDANDYVDLGIGGEQITGCCSWGPYTFVFLETWFAVFFGNSTDAQGDAEFNYNPVSMGSNVLGELSYCAPTVARDGVYFATVDGILRTQGGPPELVSNPLRPFFRGETLPYFQGPSWESNVISMTAIDDLLYVVYDTTVADPAYSTFVYDITQRAWSYWELADTPKYITSFKRSGGGREDLITVDEGASVVRIFSSGATDDAGTAISSYYRTGLTDFGAAGVEKRPRDVRLWGSGTVTYKSARDWGDLGTGQTAALGTAPDVDDALIRSNTRPGHHYSFEISGTGQWTVQRVDIQLDSPRPEGVRAA